MSVYYDVLELRWEGERHKRTEMACGVERPTVVVRCYCRRNCLLSCGRSLAVYLVAGLVLFTLQANGETQDGVNPEPTRALTHEVVRLEPHDQEVVPVDLIKQLRDKWRAEAIAATSDARISEDHRSLLVDALSRVNWTPFCSYTEESIVPDEKEARIRHHVFEYSEDKHEALMEEAAESTSDFDAETDGGGSGGFASSLNEFGGMRENLAAAKVVDASNLTVIYELPVPRGLLEEDASAEGMEARFMKRLMENLRVLFTVDVKNRGPKEIRVELLKPVRVFPGVKMKKVNFTTSFRYLDDVQEFAADRNASELSVRAFLVAGFSEIESKTLSDLRCIQKG